MESLTQLLNEIGDENVTVQALHQCMDSAQYNKGRTTIKFKTDGLGATELADGKKTALIVWVDADKYNNALANAKTMKKPSIVESLREAIQQAEELGLVRTEDGTVITGAIETDDGIVLVKE
ncbi:TPA: hypothetical protein ACF373_003854 [Vibrio parahaemolyticus]